MDERDVREALREGDSLADVAKERGRSVDGLKQAIRDAIREDADQGVEDGVLTKQQADRLVEKFSGAVDELVEQGGGPGLKFDFRGPGPGFGLGPSEKRVVPGGLPGPDLIKTALDYLGMDGADLREASRDGKSLADLAKSKGKSVDGLKEALRDAIREDADRAVEDGVLTEKQANRLVEMFGNAVDKLVEGSLRRGFDFDLRDDAGEFGLRFRIAPDRGLPSPDEQWGSSPRPPIALPWQAI
jgi:lambda repressor-like predicted transcriptional regulator